MILSRMAFALRNLAWGTVVLEILIVVTGIFLGLQVDDWNNSRKDRQSEQLYLARLYEDLTLSITETVADIEQMRHINAEAALVLGALRSGRLLEVDRADFANGLFHLGKISPPNLMLGTMEELRTTGRLTLIRSERIRAEMAWIIQRHGELGYILDNITTRMAPHILYVDSRVMFDIRDSVDGWQALDPGLVRFDFPGLAADPRFETAIASIIHYTWEQINNNEAVLARYHLLRDRIAGAVSSPTRS